QGIAHGGATMVRRRKKPLSVDQILAWADAHQKRTGMFPVAGSGPVNEAPGETWMAIDVALRYGRRGLPRGRSLAQLLQQKPRIRHIHALPLLTVSKILAWDDSHQRRTGRFATREWGQDHRTERVSTDRNDRHSA